MTNRNTSRRRNPSPQPTAETAQAAPDTGSTVVPFAGTQRGQKNAADIRNARHSEAMQQKSALVGQVRETLSEAAKLSLQGEGKATEATEKASVAAGLIYNGMISAVLSFDEATEHLGSAFGFRKKGDASTRVKAGDKEASKTPYGMGEAIRKRVVRAMKATDYVRTGEPPVTFFAAIPQADVAPLITELQKGEKSIWTVYDSLGKLRQNNSDGTRVNPAWDASKVGSMGAVLAKDGAATVQALLKDDDLFGSYADLYAILGNVFADEALIAKAEAA